MTKLIPQHQLAGERGQVLDSHQAADAFRQALNYPYENSPGDALRREFRSLNRHLGEHVKPGQMVIFSDSRHYMCQREEARMMIAAQKVNEALKELSDEEASFMVEHHEVIEPFLEMSAGSLGVASFMIGQHLESLKITLKDLEDLHQQQFKKYGHLHAPEFFSKRKRLMATLDASLGPLIRKGTGIADHPKLKRALGLSTRRVIHRWDIEGAKLVGNVGGAAIATSYTAPITMKYCAGVALKTRGIGGVICVLVISGAAASLGGNAGSKAVESTAEVLYESSTHD